MMYELIDIENRATSLNDRKGLSSQLTSTIKHNFYENENDALKYYTEKNTRELDYGGKYDKKFMEEYIKEVDGPDYGFANSTEEEDI